MSHLKIYLFLCSLVFLVMAVCMLTTSFFPPCDEGRGTGLKCDFVTGKVAHVNGPAKISVYGWENFSITVFNSDGLATPITPLNIGGWYTLAFQTTASTEILITKSNGGVSTPSIRVDRLDGEPYPSLLVTRSWYHPLTQILQWYLFPVFLMNVFVFALMLYVSIKVK